MCAWSVTLPVLQPFLACSAGTLTGIILPGILPRASEAAGLFCAATVFLILIVIPGVRRGMPDGAALFLLACSSCLGTIARRPPPATLPVQCEANIVILYECKDIREFKRPGTGAIIETSVIRAFDSAGATIEAWSDSPASLRLVGPSSLRPGDVCAVRARFLGRATYENDVLIRQGLSGNASAKRLRFSAHVRDLVILETRGTGFRRFDLRRLRNYLSGGLRYHLTEPCSAFLEAILIGRRSMLPCELRERLRLAGGYHILAISGLHIGFLSLLLMTIAGSAGISRRSASILCMFILSSYVALVGGSPSSIRACIMVCVFLGAFVVQRFRSPLNSLVFAALTIILIHPRELLKPGFLLSFSAVAALLLTSGAVRSREIPIRRHLTRKLIMYGVTGIQASTVVFLAQVPVMSHFFGTLYPISIFSNIFIIPLLGITLGIGFFFLIVLQVSDAIAGFVAPVVEIPVRLLFEVAELFARTPELCIGHRYAAELSILCAGLLLAARNRRMPTLALALIALLSFTCITDVLPARRGRSDRGPSIAFLDVGNGDCSVIEWSGGECIVVDTGMTSTGGYPGQLRRYLTSRSTTHIDALILTHPHDDHIGDVSEILEAFEVKAVIGTNAGWPSSRYASILEVLETARIPHYVAGEGDTITIGESSLVFLNPRDGFDCLTHENDYSLVFRLETTHNSVLFTGDAGTCSERTMMRRLGRALESDILKVGHHGSASSTSEEFLELVRPRIAVISCGRDGRFDHPSPAIVRRLLEHGVGVLRTDLAGGILIDGTDVIRPIVSLPGQDSGPGSSY